MKKRKKALSIILALFLLLSFPVITPAEESLLFGLSESVFDMTDPGHLDVSGISVGQIFLPARSDIGSDYLALQLLALCSGHTAENTSLLFDSADIGILMQAHYEKEQEDPSHTCAFTIGQGEVLQQLLFSKKAIFVVIRGTNEGEWYSDFDICPSGNEESVFCENFLYCAEDVFLSLKTFLDQEEDPLVIVCGHSRGAGCANLLGVLLNEYLGSDRVYVYTFACPATVKADAALSDSQNIFNYINPCDLIPRLPLQRWEFTRAGNDIVLNCEEEGLKETEERYTDVFYALSPSVSSYYQDRHSMSGPGCSEEGLTAFEVLMMLGNSLAKISLDAENESLTEDNPLQTGLFRNDLFAIDGSDNAILKEDSDLYPLVRVGNELLEDDMSLGREILHQHLADIYIKLIIERLFEQS